MEKNEMIENIENIEKTENIEGMEATENGIEITKVEQEYGADEIQVLEGLEAVRKRPGMYIGSTGPRGLHHLVYEIVDNSIDEALAGYCSKIEVVIEKGDIIRVSDNGRGIPVGVNSKTGLPAVTVVFTVLHALIQAYVLTMLTSFYYGEVSEVHHRNNENIKAEEVKNEEA